MAGLKPLIKNAAAWFPSEPLHSTQHTATQHGPGHSFPDLPPTPQPPVDPATDQRQEEVVKNAMCSDGRLVRERE